MRASILFLLLATVAVAVFNETLESAPRKTVGHLMKLVYRKAAKVPVQDATIYWEMSMGESPAAPVPMQAYQLYPALKLLWAAFIMTVGLIIVLLSVKLLVVLLRHQNAQEEIVSIPSRVVIQSSRYGGCVDGETH